MTRTTEHLGGKLGPRLAKLVTDAHAVATAKASPHRVRLAMHVQDQFFKLVGHEIGDTLGPTFRQIAEHPDTPPQLAQTFAFMADGLGQWQTFLATHAGGAALSVGLGALLNNELAPAVGDIISTNPNGRIDIATAASLAARGLLGMETADAEARHQGLGPSRFASVVRGAQGPPPVDAILTLMRRGKWDAGTVSRALAETGIADEYLAGVVDLLRVDLQPAMLADAVVRGLITEAEAATAAWRSGVDGDDFALMVKDTGEAPALQTLLEAYRRGLITDPELEHGIRTGRLRNEWIPLAKQLRYSPPGPADAIRAAVQGHLPMDRAQRLAADAGLDPANFQWLFDTAGEPIAVGQALELLNRGVMTQGEAEQVVRESRIKTKYVPQVIELRKHVLPVRTVVAMLRAGALDVATATRHLLDNGVVEADIHALIAEASHGKSGTVRELTEAQILELHADGALTEAQTVDALDALGFDAHEAHQLLTLAELRKARRLQTAVVNVVRSRFVARHIDTTATSSALDAAELDAAERDQLIALWTLERDTTTRLPTVAELTAAFKAGALDAPGWGERLLALGYATEDLPIMAAAHKVS